MGTLSQRKYLEEKWDRGGYEFLTNHGVKDCQPDLDTH